MEKGEIARYKQFLFFPQCFQKASFPGASKGVNVWEWVYSLPNDKILDQSNLKDFEDNKISMAYVTTFVVERVENIEGKGKMLVTSIFSFSLNVFKRPLCQGRLK